MAGTTALSARRRMLKNKGAVRIGMTTRALRLLEATQLTAELGSVRIVAGNTSDRALAKPMVLAEFKLGKNVLVTRVAGRRTLREAPQPQLLEPFQRRLPMGAVTVVATHACLIVGIARRRWAHVGVTGLTRCRALMGRLIVKRQHRIRFAWRRRVRFPADMAGIAAERVVDASGPCRHHVTVARQTDVIGRQRSGAAAKQKKQDPAHYASFRHCFDGLHREKYVQIKPDTCDKLMTPC